MNPTSRLILIGTVHLDPSGSQGLDSVLNLINPKIITVEISRFSVRYREEHQVEWLNRLRMLTGCLPPEKRNHLQVKLLRAQLTMPFEWRTSSSFSGSSRSLAIDSGRLSQKELPSWRDELITRKNIARICDTPDIPLDEYMKARYREAIELLSHPDPHKFKWLDDEYWCWREKLLAKRIKKIFSLTGFLVHVGGWAHLVDHPGIPSLLSMISVYNPTRFLVIGRKFHRLTS